MTENRSNGAKNIALNRRARHDYFILETVEAGIVLTGTEIKSVREGRVSIVEAFAKPENGELWLMNAHIAKYGSGGVYNHEPTRPRKLLLHKDQLRELVGKVSQKGLTLVPLRIYIRNHVAKVELGLAKGRKLYDKRQVIAEREAEREIDRAAKSRR